MDRFVRIGLLLLAPLWLGGCSIKVTSGNPGDSATSAEMAAPYDPNAPVYLTSHPGVAFYEWYDPGCNCFTYVRYCDGWWVTPYGVRTYHGRDLPHHDPPPHAFAGRHPQHVLATVPHPAQPVAHGGGTAVHHEAARSSAPPQVRQPAPVAPTAPHQEPYRHPPAPAQKQAPPAPCDPKHDRHC